MKSALRITLIYIVFASLWIVLSDRAIVLFTDKVAVLTTYASIKGLFFVLITSILLFVLIRKEVSIRNSVIAEQNKLLELKEELIRKLHHRIKNTIQVIIGVLGLETGDTDFSIQAKDRIVNRLLSMRSVYDVVYDYKDMKEISLGSVLAEYGQTGSRNMRIAPPASSILLPVETLVPLLLVLDVVLESIAGSGYRDTIEVAASGPGFLELRLGGCADDLETLLGANASFVRIYLKSLAGDSADNVPVRLVGGLANPRAADSLFQAPPSDGAFGCIAGPTTVPSVRFTGSLTVDG